MIDQNDFIIVLLFFYIKAVSKKKMRSNWKIPFFYFKLNKFSKKVNQRGLIINPLMINGWFSVHNGKEYKLLQLEKLMLGHRLGEFSFTRIPFLHRRKQTIKIKKSKK